MMVSRVWLVTSALVAVCAIMIVTAQQPQPAPTTGFTAAQAERGRTAYISNCAGCHGMNLDDGSSDAPPLTGVNFVTFWGPKSVSDLFNYIMNSVAPAAPGSRGDGLSLEVAAYIMQRLGAAPGNTPLVSTSTATLNAVGRAGGGGRGGRGGGGGGD